MHKTANKSDNKRFISDPHVNEIVQNCTKIEIFRFFGNKARNHKNANCKSYSGSKPKKNSGNKN